VSALPSPRDAVAADAQVVPAATIEAAREEFLRQALVAFEEGTLDASQYSACVRALETAATVTDMAGIAARSTGSSPVRVAGGALDPVDLARLAKSPSMTRARSPRARYTALLLVVVVLAAMVMAGMIFAMRLRAAPPSGGAVVPVSTTAGTG